MVGGDAHGAAKSGPKAIVVGVLAAASGAPSHTVMAAVRSLADACGGFGPTAPFLKTTARLLQELHQACEVCSSTQVRDGQVVVVAEGFGCGAVGWTCHVVCQSVKRVHAARSHTSNATAPYMSFLWWLPQAAKAHRAAVDAVALRIQQLGAMHLRLVTECRAAEDSSAAATTAPKHLLGLEALLRDAIAAVQVWCACDGPWVVKVVWCKPSSPAQRCRRPKRRLYAAAGQWGGDGGGMGEGWGRDGGGMGEGWGSLA